MNSLRTIVALACLFIVVLTCCVYFPHLIPAITHPEGPQVNSSVSKLLSTNVMPLPKARIALISSSESFVKKFRQAVPGAVKISPDESLLKYDIVIVYGSVPIRKLSQRIDHVLNFLACGKTLVLVDPNEDPLRELFTPRIRVVLSRLAFIPVKYVKVKIVNNTKVIEKVIPGFVDNAHVVVMTGWKLEGGKIGVYYTVDTNASVNNIFKVLKVHVKSYREYMKFFENSSTSSKWVAIFATPVIKENWKPIGGYSSPKYCIDSKCKNIMWYRIKVGFTRFDIGCYNTKDHKCNEWGILFDQYIYADNGFEHTQYFCPAWLCSYGYWVTQPNIVNISNDDWYVDQDIIDFGPSDVKSCSPGTVGFSSSIPELGISVTMPLGGNAGPAIETKFVVGKAVDGYWKAKYAAWKWGFAVCPFQSAPGGKQEFVGGVVIISRVHTKHGWFTFDNIEFTTIFKAVVVNTNTLIPEQHTITKTQQFIATTDQLETR